MSDNSPAFQFQRRDTSVRHERSPEGTAEADASAVPSGLMSHKPQPGVETPGYSHSSLRDARATLNMRCFVHGSLIQNSIYIQKLRTAHERLAKSRQRSALGLL